MSERINRIPPKTQVKKALRLTVLENRVEVNVELMKLLVARCAGHDLLDRLRREREKKLRDPQDVLIDADRLRRSLKQHRAQ